MIHGVLLIDKPHGPTSHDVVNQVRRLFGMKKVGHAGTLDPFATGLLILLLGDATRLSKYLLVDEKEYEATCLWGVRTDTGDPTGNVVERIKVPLPQADRIRDEMKRFLGDQKQIPPRYSAKRVKGRRMYEMARRGEEILRESVVIRVASLELISCLESEFAFRVRCSKGTYIRTLGEDLCRTMGGVGYLNGLRRIASGPFHVKNAVAPDRLSGMADEGLATGKVLSIESVCTRFPAVVITDRAAEALRYGATPDPADLETWESFQSGDAVRILDSANRLLALVIARLGDDEMASRVRGKKAFKIDINFAAKTV